MSGGTPSVGARLAELGADLVTVEVNTIVKSGISAGKMPQPEHALIDIAVDMWRYLIDAGAIPAKTDAEWYRDVQAGWSGWDACRQAAQAAPAAAAPPSTEDQKVAHDVRIGKLERIVSACDQLKGVLYDTAKANAAMAGGRPSLCGPVCVISRDKTTGAIRHTHNGEDVSYAPASGRTDRRRWIPLDTRQLAVVRKIWEVGLEDIAFQTVMQLDGDFVTRIHPAYLGNEWLMRIHQESVRASQSLWKELVDIALRLFGAVADVFKG